MRAKLFYTLAGWMLLAVTISIVSMAAFSAWNLRQGFSAYLQARDAERLDRFVELLTVSLRRARDETGELPRRIDMQTLLHDLAVAEGATDPPVPVARQGGAAPPEGLRGGPPPEAGPPPGGAIPIPPPGPPPKGPDRLSDAFGARASVARADGAHWAGPRPPAGGTGLIERPVYLDGQLVAVAQLRPMARSPHTTERQFLRWQYLGIAGVALVLLLMAAVIALWLARQWQRPLTQLQLAAGRIAQGDFSERLDTGRTDEFGDLMRKVNDMAANLQRIEGARRRWLADLSHELRTPLAVLQGDIEALADGVRPLRSDSVLALRDDVRRMAVLVNDLHLLAMSDLNALPCYWSEADAQVVFRHAAERLAPQAASQGLKLRWPSDTSAPVPVVWDSLRIDQLLDNLLHNSLRYTDAPGHIELDWHCDATHCHFIVQDSVPGVPDQDLPRLFEPLYRADTARQRTRGGSGLGLAISAAIVTAHGGTLKADHSPLGGLRVALSLPRVAPASRS